MKNPPVVEKLAVRYQDPDPYGHINYQSDRLVAEGSSAQVFFEPETGEVCPRPEWFLAAIREPEDRSEGSFASLTEKGR